MHLCVQVTLERCLHVAFVPHAQHDPSHFESLAALVERVEGQGYYGGVRLLMVSAHAGARTCTASTR